MLPDKCKRFVVEDFFFDRQLPESVVISYLVIDLVAITAKIVHQYLGEFSSLVVRLAADDLERCQELVGRNDVLLDEQVAEFSLGFLCWYRRRHGVFLLLS